MQDEYNKAFDKIHMDNTVKANMRKVLESEIASNKKPAKVTRISGTAKAGIAAAAVAVTLTGLFVIPSTRNTILATINDLFHRDVPTEAVDMREEVQENRENRVIPTDVPEASEILEIVASQDQEEDEWLEYIDSSSDNYSDENIKDLARYYEEQGCTINDLKKNIEYQQNSGDELNNFSYYDDIEEGFTVYYWVGDYAYGHAESVLVMKISKEGLDKYLFDESRYIMRTQPFDLTPEEADNIFTESTDEDGNLVYTASLTGDEPELVLNDSDRAVFMDYEIIYDPETQIASVFETTGGGVG